MGKHSKGAALRIAQSNLMQQGISQDAINAEMGRLKGMRPREIQALNQQHFNSQPKDTYPTGPYNMGGDIALPPGGQYIQPWPGSGGVKPMPRPMRPPGSPHTMPVGQPPQPMNEAGLQQLSQALGGMQPMPKQPMQMNQQPAAGFLSNLSSNLNSYKW